MATIPLVSTTGVVSGTAGYDFVFESESYWRVTVAAYGLGVGENVTIFIVAPSGALIAAVDENGAAAYMENGIHGPSVLVGGPTYLARTIASAAPVSVSISPCNRS